MPRLSIVITSWDSADRLEASLVSVLSNRPADAEVLVVSNVPYDDPYELAGEVRFVEMGADARWTDLANAGLEQSKAPVVHLLAAGVEISEGWADEACRHFEDPHVAAVVPVAYGDAQRKRVVSAGVTYGRGGTRRLVCGRASRLKSATWSERVLAPSPWAGFYRKRALAEPVGGFSAAVGDAATDAELGLRLRHAGYRVMVEPESAVFVAGEAVPPGSEYARALGAERLFWRHAGLTGWGGSLGWHALSTTGSIVGSMFRLATCGQLAGRLVGSFDALRQIGYRCRLAELPGAAEAMKRELLSIEQSPARQRRVGQLAYRKSA